ncbi:aspartate/glutamate racemase family protein [Ramlibacter sp.]|uniref:aspartate/glutamate racemase family protein n=1 Tax=Ramlibacter sp. TaxID=1917967 RepID=UPI003D0B5F51
MKILLVNPNTTQAVTDLVLRTAQAAAREGTAFEAVTGTFGPEIIGSRAENALATHGVLELVARHAAGCDAVVLAVSLDTAAWACRELLPIPVVAMTEAALHTAALLAPRFAVLTYGKRLVPVYQELVAGCGLSSRLSAVNAVDVTPQQSFTDPEFVLAEVRAAVLGLVEGGAEAVVLAGAAMAAMAHRLQPDVPVPLLDGVACAVGFAEMLATLRPPRARTGSVSGTGGRAVNGVSAELQALFMQR